MDDRMIEATAAALRTISAAAQIASGPALAIAIAAASEAGVAALASIAAVRAMDGMSVEHKKLALAYAIEQVEAEELCDPLLADAWRFAIGAHAATLRKRSAQTVARAAAGAAVTRVLKKHAIAKLFKVLAVTELVRAPARARTAHRLVARARHHAREYATRAPLCHVEVAVAAG